MEPQTQEAPVARKRAPTKAKKAVKAKPVDKAKLKAAAQKTATDAAKKALPALAHEINVRFGLAEQNAKKSDDHRLAAALQLAKAEELCKANGIPWKEWVSKNVKQSYETVRKLVSVGKADKPILALADQRMANAERNKAFREKTKKKVAAITAAAPRTAPAPEVLAGVDALKAAFSDLKPKDRVDFVKWAASETGFKLVDEFETATPPVAQPTKAPATRSRTGAKVTDDDLLDIPAHRKK